MGATGAALALDALVVVLPDALGVGLDSALGSSATAALAEAALAAGALAGADLALAAGLGVAGDEAGALAVVLLTSGLLAVAMYLMFATACESAASLEARGL